MKRFLIILYAVLCTLYAFGEAKYVFYFIGDGMGTNQVLAAEMYRSALQGEPLGRVQTLMTQMPYMGHLSTHSASNGITDSSAAGTCLATGKKTTNGTLGLGPDGEVLPRPLIERIQSTLRYGGLLPDVEIVRHRQHAGLRDVREIRRQPKHAAIRLQQLEHAVDYATAFARHEHVAARRPQREPVAIGARP